MRHALLLHLFLSSFFLPAQNAAGQADLYADLIDRAREFALAGERDSAWQLTLKAANVWESPDAFFGFLEAFEETATFYISDEMLETVGRKDYKTAAEYFAFALEKFPLSFDQYDAQEAEYLADLNVMLGNAYKRTSRILEAKASYQKAFSGYRHLDSLAYDYDKRWVALFVYKPLANIYTRLENYENATSLLLLARSVLEDSGKKGEAAQAAIDLGILYATTERHQEAVSLFEQQFKNPDLSDYIRAVLLLNKARSLMQLSRTDAGLKDIQSAISVLKQGHWNSILMDAYHVLGQLQVQKGDTQNAKASLNRAIILSREVLPTRSRKRSKIYASTGELYLRNNELETALLYYQKSLFAVLNNIDSTDVSSMPDPRDLYAENSILTALDGKAAAFEKWYKTSGNPDYLIKALKNLQAGFDVEHLIQNAQQHSTSKIQFQKQNQSRRERAIALCVTLSEKTGEDTYLDIAFQIAEASKAAVLLESVRENLARRQLKGTQQLIQQVKETEKALAAIESELLAVENPEKGTFDELNEQKVFLSQKLLTLKKSLEEQHPEYANLNAREKVVSVAEVQKILLKSREEVFVEFFWGTGFLYVFKIEKEAGITFLKIPLDEDFQNTFTQFLDLFSADNRWKMGAEAFQSAAFNLYQKIYAPLQIETFSGVTVVPDGLLAFIPFEALVTEWKTGAFFKNLAYVIHRQNIKYAYSGSVLQQQQQAVASGQTFLFIAPGFADGQLGLPALDASDLDIGHPPGLKRLMDNEATRSNFENEAALSRVIHLFTHAEANQTGLQPRVFFFDEALTLSEIYALDLSAELVVLSACETNLGKLEKGEGVMSLARGFAYAGASSLIASLWKVKNRQTADIFSSFYKNLEAGKSKSEALRDAKLGFLEQTDDIHASPAYWTGFVFIGSDTRESPEQGIHYLLLVGLALMAAGIVFFMRIRKK